MRPETDEERRLLDSHRTFGDIVYEAVRDPERTVELDIGERYGGFVVVVDGVPLPGPDEGFARESLGFPIDRIHPADESRALVFELLREYEQWINENKLERARERSEAHRLAEGIDL